MDNANTKLTSENLDTLFHECRQCGTCCKTYRKVLLEPDEIDRLRALGAEIGVMVSLNDLRKKTMNELVEEARGKKAVYMIHPDGNGCIFLQKVNGNYRCKIYHYRPRACQGFRCSLADHSMEQLLLNDPIFLLGEDRFGRKLETH
ncbi:YkgJ family cysteine cluster protein [uncultured Desulfuromusa sp.]|uniref:YkgJ family cysteine cluster protein n=1 Tax=uncultured Desulfuromusa sp. TaxID=219183 RepID=UPI002AA77170|nr:YkgJ family cysteine cluster protein [uncultured Desulfuromusa sp.]